ncbi:MAG: ATP-binding protein [Candidatus Hydrothermarchaeales archaeon]
MMKFLQRGLLTKLMVYFLITSLVPLTIIGYMVFVNGRRALEEETINQLTMTWTLKEGEINTWISEKEGDILLLSKTPDTHENLIHLATSEKSDPVYVRAYRDFLDHSETMVREAPDFREIFYVGADKGEVIASTTKKNEGKDESNADYFVEGKKGTYIGEVLVSLELGRPVITIATPINNGTGELVGVLAGRINLDKMDKIMTERTGLGETGETYLINKYYRYASDPRLIAGVPIKKEIHTEAIDDCLLQKSGVGLYDNPDGVPVIGSYKWMEATQLCILAEISQAEAFESILRFQNIVVTLWIVIALFLIIFVVLLSHSLIKPIDQLVKGTERIGRGDLQYKIDIESKDEVGRLAESFNKMTKNLGESQKRLIQSEKLASLGRLAAGVAHEINSPLTNISTSAQILIRKMDEDDPKMERLKVIEENIDLATTIVRGLLDFARQPKPKFENVDINGLLLRTLKMLKYQITNVKVTKDLDPNLPSIMGDSRQLQQVFINHMVNACQAMPDGGELTISTRKEADFVEIDIKDTGHGISKENMDKIFDPFFTTREYKEGTGLGLSISHGIIERHKGRIDVKSKIGEGTTFTIKLLVGKGE